MHNVEAQLPLEDGRKKLLANKKLILFIAMLVLFNVTPYLGLSSYANSFIQNMSINMVMALSLYIIIVMDIISLAQSGFMAIGAYTSVLLALNGYTDVLFLIICAALISSLSGLLFGLIVSKVRGVYFVLVSFAFTGLITSIVTNTQALGGANGFSNLPELTYWLPFLGVQQLSSAESMMKLILIVTTVIIVFARIWTKKYSKVTRSIHEDENLSRSLGLHIVKFRTVGLCLSAGMAGVGGVLISFYLTSISPDTFHWTNSVSYLAFNIVGGTGSIAGPIIGGFFLEYLSQSFSGLVEYNLGLYGIVLIIFTVLLKEGLYGIILRGVKRIFPKYNGKRG
jgi:branched-chain amino acid transport system permease protein